MVSEPRRAVAAFALSDENGAVVQSGEAEAVIGDDGLSVGPVTVSFLDADVLLAADYSLEIQLWPGGRLVLSQLGRRFDTFAQELRTVRNRARVAGLLAHGVTMPELFQGAVLSDAGPQPVELQVYDTHVTVVPADGDPWQLPFGAVTVVRSQLEPPAVALETAASLTIFGQLARRREAFEAAVIERREAQRQLLEELTGVAGFSDGWGKPRRDVTDFDHLLDQFTSPERAACRRTLLAASNSEGRLGFVQLLDPDNDALQSPSQLPPNWAAFLLVPIGSVTVLEILAGPSAATYVFRGEMEAVNRDLQLLHFRRAPLALTSEQAQLTPDNPYRLALRRLEPLQRLRSITVGRLIHSAGWEAALRDQLTGGPYVARA